jgi:PilZ domain
MMSASVTCVLAESSMVEKRATPRQRVLKSGTIEFGGGVIDCTVRNLSTNGAALDVATPVGIPATFNLAIPSDGLRFACRVLWRKDRRIGVKFV